MVKSPDLGRFPRAVRLALLLMVFLTTSLPACRFPGTVRPVVKIGLVAPFEGRYRYIGYDVIYAVRLAVREVNAAGGVAGYGVELVAYDDGADSIQAPVQARKLAVDPAVLAVIGHFREETTRSAARAYAEAGLPLVGPAVLASDLAADGAGISFYRLGPPAPTVADAILEQLGRRRVQNQRAEPFRVALVTQGGPLGRELQQRASPDFPLTPVTSPEKADWMAVVTASHPDVVLCDADPVTAGEIVAALREAGWEGEFWGGPELAAADFAAVAGATAAGATFVTPYPFPTDVPDGADFVAAYREVSGGVSPGPLALPAYEAANLLLEALAQDISPNGPTRAGMTAALSAVEWPDAKLYWYRVDEGGTFRPAQF